MLQIARVFCLWQSWLQWKTQTTRFPGRKCGSPCNPRTSTAGVRLETLTGKELLLHPHFCGRSPVLVSSPIAGRLKKLWNKVGQASKCRVIFVYITWSRVCCLCWMFKHLLRARKPCFRVYFFFPSNFWNCNLLNQTNNIWYPCYCSEARYVKSRATAVCGPWRP